MKKSLSIVAVLVLAASVPAGAWGTEAHRFVLSRAIDLLPDAIRPFYQAHRSFLLEHAGDPDLWRVVGFAEEGPRHFLDLDAYGAFPFDALPREYGDAIEKHGPETLARYGVLPWRVEELYGRLVRALQGTTPYALDDALYLSAVLAHYAADAHVPLHAVLNYDGQATNQLGIHARFESELFTRYEGKLNVRPQAIPPIADARSFAFDAMLASYRAVEGILAADRKAIGSGEVYDDRYYEAFFGEVRPILEDRLSRAAVGVAALITGAWETAGKPDVVTPRTRPVEKVRRVVR